MWRYIPGLLLTYAVGIVAVASENWPYVQAIFDDNFIEGTGYQVGSRTIRAMDAIVEGNIVYYDKAHVQQRRNTNDFLGDELEKLLSPLFESILIDIQEYHHALDIFEFLYSLAFFADPRRSENERSIPPQFWRIVFEPKSEAVVLNFVRTVARMSDDWAGLKAGLFDGSPDKFGSILKQFQNRLNKVAAGFKFGEGPPQFFSAYIEGQSPRR
jgi:hypothetical protein